jgi:hypothetical protein
MNKEFTRMQKLAGILTEGMDQGNNESPHLSTHQPAEKQKLKPKYEPGSNSSISDKSAETALGMMTMREFKKKVKAAILAEKALKEDAAGGNLSTDQAYAAMGYNMEEANAPIHTVTTVDGKTIVGTHQHGVGFKSNENGKKMGFKDNPTSIPNGTKMQKPDGARMQKNNSGMLEGDYLDETSYEGMEGMDGLVNQNDIRAFLSIADRIMMQLHKEGFDYDDIINYLSELLIDPPAGSISEAKKKKEEEAPEEEDVDIDLGTDGENIDLNLDGEGGTDNTKVDMNMDTAGDIDAGSSESKKAFSELTDAYRAAKELGDEKLIRQIANTITYFNKNIILSQG